MAGDLYIHCNNYKISGLYFIVFFLVDSNVIYTVFVTCIV